MSSGRTHLLLLRGINVGGRNRLAMADFVAVLESLGHEEVVTYIQSGNAAFRAGALRRGETADPAALAGAVEKALALRCGVTCGAVAVSRDEFAEVIAANPYVSGAGRDPKTVHVVLRGADFTPDELTAMSAAYDRARAKGSPDEMTVVGRTLYLQTPAGLGRSELAAQLSRTAGMRSGTARNWATVTRLAELLD